MINGAARVLTRDLAWEHREIWTVSLQMLGAILLFIAVITSALSVIYIKALQRDLCNELQASQSVYDNLKIKQDQLLLEEKTWSSLIRIHTLAQKKLDMHLPMYKNTIMITQYS